MLVPWGHSKLMCVTHLQHAAAHSVHVAAVEVLGRCMSHTGAQGGCGCSYHCSLSSVTECWVALASSLKLSGFGVSTCKGKTGRGSLRHLPVKSRPCVLLYPSGCFAAVYPLASRTTLHSPSYTCLWRRTQALTIFAARPGKTRFP